MEPIVGTAYQVPCILVEGMELPVHLPIHSDPELGAPWPHVHVDLRFLAISPATVSWIDPSGLLRLLLWVHPAALENVLMRVLFFQVVRARPEDIVTAEMVCQRAMPPYPRHRAAWLGSREPFAERYSAQCPPTDRCPHKGLPLILGDDGRRHCPGHGLCFERVSQ
mgnify:CR=1 FL=1